MKEWNKIDLHIHAEHGLTFDNKSTDNNPNFYSLKNMIERNKINDLRLVALTEHNLINIVNNLKLSYALNKYSNSDNLPGVEVDVVISENRYHVILIFSKRVNIINISSKLNKYIRKKTNYYLNLDELLDVIINTECIIIPHACKKSGIKPNTESEIDDSIAFGIVDVLRSGNFVNLLFENTKQYYNGSFARSVLERASKNWISEEEMSTVSEKLKASILGSDFRFRTNEVKLSEKEFSAIWANPTFRGMELVCLFPNNRIEVASKIIEKSNYISRIEIKSNEFFENSNITFSSGLNSIVGSSASGKTALIHIIANKLNGKSVKGKKYEFTNNLEVKFYDKDDNPINKDDIKIEVAESIYDKIAKIHNSDIQGILDIFSYKINRDSSVLRDYESRIKDYSKFETSYNTINEDLMSSIEKLVENTSNLVLNTHGTNKELIERSIVVNTKGRMTIEKEEIISTIKTIVEMGESIVALKNKFDEIKYIIEKYGLKSNISELRTQLQVELENLKSNLSEKLVELNREILIQEKLALIITTYNAKIGQKSEYIQRLNNNVLNSKEKVINQIRNLCILELRKRKINLSFPKENLKDELSKSNTNDYIDLEIVINDDIFCVKNDSGLLEYERNAIALKVFKERNIFDDINIKSMITSIVAKGANPIFRYEKLLDTIISNSIVKIGYPGEAKISIEDISPGDASKIYIDFKFKTDLKNGNFNIVVFDQPENDVDKEFIFNNLLSQINDLKMEKQVILTSHDPLIVINGDSNRIIKASKHKKKIQYNSFSLEEYVEDIPITSVVSRFVDGNELAVKQRFELYSGGNAKW